MEDGRGQQHGGGRAVYYVCAPTGIGSAECGAHKHMRPLTKAPSGHADLDRFLRTKKPGRTAASGNPSTLARLGQTPVT